ncbi:SDR family oxidoreductase [Erwinia tracheiphila]|uniref:SDR family NAD(P)-dependent oxidoreductase n=1 Tax=Erwinia tracheiphila TaxID=65700 RepID=A0A345CTK2_9GAMM|nr:SDR family NAD(P)-dependent oxidoreductase [Erwinia tracheiphila]AXF76769.1 SDR family NAD(P)-dependent oxidoreductase [Erwinia tracheiphila]UIA84552.1 SDR family oxidoreductase [Erwinia tracheiphila]UIA93145.1 SDR family oxidoreductase [Erwinia tracheiphila]
MDTPYFFHLSGKTALISGGLRGLGLHIAEALDIQDTHLVISAHHHDELRKTQSHLSSMNIEADWIVADNTINGNTEYLSEEAISKTGKIDILVNNAGIVSGATAEDHTVEGRDRMMNLNIRSHFLLTQIIGKRRMIPRNCGKIINVASVAGLQGNIPSWLEGIAYSTSEGAMVNFTRALAGEWGEFNITVNVLAPGFFPSAMLRNLFSRLGTDFLAQRAPPGRIGDDKNLKGAAILFASNASKYITGQILVIDGE